MTDSSNYWSNAGSGAIGDDTANRSFDLLRYGPPWKNSGETATNNSFQSFEHLTSEKSAIYDQRKIFKTNQVYSNEYYQQDQLNHRHHPHHPNIPNITASAAQANTTLSSSQALSSSLFSNSSNSICSPIENNTTLTQQFNQLKLQTKSNNNNFAFNQHHSNNTENNINSNSNRTSFNLSNYFNQNVNSHSVICSSPSNIDINSPTSNILDSDSNYQSPPHDFDNGFKQRPNTLPLASTERDL